jgi:hypothetical protein
MGEPWETKTTGSGALSGISILGKAGSSPKMASQVALGK